jgi:AcrR family transcriptional regulator
MVARAESADATRRRILDAAIGILFGSAAPLTLDETARRAGVSTQTLLRVFGTRTALVKEAATEAWRRVVDQRSAAPIGDIPGSVKVLLMHYETYGDRLVRARARESDTPELSPGLYRAQADHRRWVARTYRPQLARRPEVLNPLLAVTDVFTWKVLRRDLDLDRREAEATLMAMIRAIAE